ncbi:hypothetical protein MJH12_13480, partial [bacterium]|nr:hypothetical protein [bacterium]
MRHLYIVSLILCSLLINSTFAGERYVYRDKITEVDGRDFEQIIHNTINQYYDIQDIYSLERTSLQEKKYQAEVFDQRIDQISASIIGENKLHQYAVFYNSCNDMQRAALNELTKFTIIRYNAQILYQDGLNHSDVRDASQLFPKFSKRASYEYAYGRELKREELKRFEMIIRNTYFENTHHKIDIDIDFLGPIKKIISALKLKNKFSWIWDQKLHFGYHSEFKHFKKVFIRE